MSSKFYMGIDPDRDKSGVVVWNKQTKEFTFMGLLSFFDLYDYLLKFNEDLHIRIEAGWLISKINWHKPGSNQFVSAKIGSYVGANHETGKKIAEMCDYLDITYTLVKPSSKKMTASDFNKIIGRTLRTNQEVRDAAMLVYGI